MRVAHITADLSKYAAGLSVAVAGLANSQANRLDYEVGIFGCDSAFTVDHIGFCSKVILYRYQSIGPRSLGFACKLTSDLLKFNPDIVHVHGLWSSSIFFGRRAAEIMKVPLVISPHGMLCDYSLKRSSLKKEIFSFFFQRKAFSQSRLIHVTCEAELAEVYRYYHADDVVVIPNGVVDTRSDKEIAPRLGNRIRTLLYLGRIHEKKGLDVLLRIWSRISYMHPDWELRIVGFGDSNSLQNLTDIVKELSLQRVTFVGPVFGDQKLQEFRAASLFVLPTRNENFGLVVAESLIEQLPVLCSTNAPWSGLNTHECGSWVSLEDHSFFRALDSLMSKSDVELELMGAKGRLWMLEEFAWSSVESSMDEVYRKIL